VEVLCGAIGEKTAGVDGDRRPEVPRYHEGAVKGVEVRVGVALGRC